MEVSVSFGLIVVALVQLLKFLVPKVSRELTVVAAGLVGLGLAAVDAELGLGNLSLAEGIAHGFAAVGGVTLAQKVNKPVE